MGVLVEFGARVGEYRHAGFDALRHSLANTCLARAHLALAVHEAVLVDVVAGVAGRQEQHLIDPFQEAIADAQHVLSAEFREWRGKCGELRRKALLGVAQRGTVRGRGRWRAGGRQMTEQFDGLGIRIDEGHADALRDRARNQQLDLKVLFDPVDEQREEQHCGRRGGQCCIGLRRGTDEHATHAEIAHRAGHGRPSGDPDQRVEIDRNAAVAALFAAAALCLPCCHLLVSRTRRTCRNLVIVARDTAVFRPSAV